MNNIRRIVFNDVANLFKNVMSVIITIGLIVVPFIFACYNIIACWDVFNNTGNLTVAVASVDEGYESDLVPLRINIGEQVISALRANDEIDWVFTGEDDAIDGAKSGRYYAALVIPQNFSKDMLTFYSNDVQHAKIMYYTNEKKNAIAPKITDKGADSVTYQVNKVFAETISEIALNIAESFSDYIDKADANGSLAHLVNHMYGIGDQIDKTASVLSLYSSLAQSSQTLIATSTALINNAENDVDGLRDEVSQNGSSVVTVAAALEQSLDSLSSTIGGMGQSFDAVSQATDELFDVTSSGVQQYAVHMRSQADSIEGQIKSYRDIAEALVFVRDAVSETYKPAIDALIARLNAVIELTEGVRDNLRRAADSLEAGDTNVQNEREEIKNSVAQMQQNAKDLKQDFDERVKPDMRHILDDMVFLVDTLSDGAENLRLSGIDLSASAGSASNLLGMATEKIDAGVRQLHASADEIRNLAGNVEKALVTNDIEALCQVLGSDTQVLSEALAAPVGIERVAVFPANNFGSAMAPLYITLALFIGSLLILLVIKPTVSVQIQEGLACVKPRELFLGRFGVIAVISLAQTTVMGLGSMLFLQVQITHPCLFMLCFWTAGLVFTFLIYALIIAFASLGKALAVLLLIVQITGCGGSFPLQLLPSFVQDLSPWLPATHVVNALRAAMFGIYGNDFWVEIGMLMLFLIPAAIIGLLLRKPLAKFMDWYMGKVRSSKLVE